MSISDKVLEAASNLEAVYALSDDELAETLSLARSEAVTYNRAAERLAGEAERRFSARKASIINVASGTLVRTHSNEYIWFQDKLEAKFRPFLTEDQWDAVAPLEAPPPPPEPRRKPHAQKIRALAEKLGDEAKAALEECYETRERNVKVDFARADTGVFE